MLHSSLLELKFQLEKTQLKKCFDYHILECNYLSRFYAINLGVVFTSTWKLSRPTSGGGFYFHMETFPSYVIVLMTTYEKIIVTWLSDKNDVNLNKLSHANDSLHILFRQKSSVITVLQGTKHLFQWTLSQKLLE